MKVFLDTNVWLSATIFPGLCAELVFVCAQHDEILSSALVRSEAHEVLQRKFPLRSEALALFDMAWGEVTRVSDIDEPASDNDARLVAAAEAAGADLFVTGDKRVLEWRGVGSMRIVSPREAWGVLVGGVTG